MDAALVLGGDERFFGRWEFGIAEQMDKGSGINY